MVLCQFYWSVENIISIIEATPNPKAVLVQSGDELQTHFSFIYA
jgi:hypothetical protein